MKRYRVLLCLLVLLLCLTPVRVLATDDIDLCADVSLTVAALYDGKPIAGMQFDAYLIANVNEHGELTVLERYSDFAEDLANIQDKNDEMWQVMASKLEREIILDAESKPTCSAVTNDSGIASFTDISTGMYLVISHGIQLNNRVYTTAPFFVMLPKQELDSNIWNYHIVANAKLEEDPVWADYTVIKVWDDACHATQRPERITIQLMCDGKPYGEPVTLPENGHWSHTWKNLDVNHKWTVTEPQQSGYAVPVVTSNGTTFIVTNTCDRPGSPDGSDTPSSLPQTGQLWWPVPLLLCTGMMFVIVGLLRRRGARR